MALMNGQVAQPNVVSAAPRPVAPLPAGAFNAQQGYNGAAGASMSPLVQALMKSKLQQKLAGQLPGTTGQTPAMPAAAAPGYFSAQSAAAAPMQVDPLSLGGMPPTPPGQ
jgi:hypothetical protein